MLAAVLAAFLTAPLSHANGHVPATGPVARLVYVVRPGDTIWSIAVHRSGGGDPRMMADAIERANRVDPGTLVPGETLVIPST